MDTSIKLYADSLIRRYRQLNDEQNKLLLEIGGYRFPYEPENKDGNNVEIDIESGETVSVLEYKVNDGRIYLTAVKENGKVATLHEYQYNRIYVFDKLIGHIVVNEFPEED